MSGYTRRTPVTQTGTAADGTVTAEVKNIGRSQHMTQNGRLPAFAGLAKATGGFYAENQGGMTLDRAMEAARMNFTVKFQDKVQVTTLNSDGATTVSYPQRGTYGEWPGGDVAGFGFVGGTYQIVQPAEAGELGQAIMDEGGANVVAAGIYGNPAGCRSYLAFQLPEGLTIGGQDRHDLYLTILNSYDGTSGLTGLFAPIRFACTNMTTATFGRKVANRFSFRHSGNTTQKVKEAREALGVATEWVDYFKLSAETLLATPMSDSEITQFVEALLPTPAKVTTDKGERDWAERRVALKKVITLADTNEFGRGTAYAAFNGAIEYADFLTPTQAGGNAGDIARYTRILQGGPTEKFKLRAGELLGVGRV
jgi:phage/plasmid-like protein (TIGR03299 family)